VELGSLTVIGGQWGDEGKGKVVDLLAPDFHAVARFNGGHNAGHTVRFGDRRFALHLVPSGIVWPETRCYLGAAMVVDPQALVTELETLAAEGVDPAGRVMLSERAALILPSHRALDLAREASRGSDRIGTTGRGIGPAYQDVAHRRGLRAYLLRDPERFSAAAAGLMELHNRELERLHGADPVDVETEAEALRRAAERLADLVGDVSAALGAHLAAGEAVLFEGAQGVLLDVYHGTYPFVTSSSCLPGLAAVSCGIPPRRLGRVLGVFKAYETRVGSGPFPTEDAGELGERLRRRGGEFGTTTGRPRRCGWFDAVAARYAVRVAGVDAVALTKLDVLDGLPAVRVAVAYEDPAGHRLATPPADPEALARVRPVYEDLPGWSGTTSGATDPDALPAEAWAYVRFLERQIGVPVVLVSTGPRREETVIPGDGPWAEPLRRAVARAVAATA